MPKRTTYIAVVAGAAFAVGMAAFAAPAVAQAAPALPFWGRPFPSGYTWHAWQDDERGCYVLRRIQTSRGPRYRWLSVCEPPLRERY